MGGQEASLHIAVARERQNAEVKRAQRTVADDRSLKAQAAEREQAVSTELARRDQEARTHQRLGAKRLKDAQAVHSERQAKGEEVRETHFQHDAQRLLTLKASMDRINRQVQSQNEAKKKKQQKIKDEREKRKKDLLSEGKNPYEVWRRA